MSKKKSQKVNVPRKVKEDLKNDSSNVENTKIELPQLPQPFLIKQEEQNKPWYKKNISIIIGGKSCGHKALLYGLRFRPLFT